MMMMMITFSPLYLCSRTKKWVNDSLGIFPENISIDPVGSCELAEAQFQTRTASRRTDFPLGIFLPNQHDSNSSNKAVPTQIAA